MADVLPKIRSDPPQTKDSPARPLEKLERQDTGKGSVKGDGSLTNGKFAAKLWPASPTSPTAASPLNAQSKEHLGQNGSAEAAIDPLSQQILQRTNTGTPTIAQKLRPQTTDNASTQSPASPNDSYTDGKPVPGDAAKDSGASASKADKKKGVSFLSRFIGTKKKGLDGADDASESGERRPEGMNAQLFSHTVDNLGFSPKQPPPPAYIKVRTKYKKDGEFNRVFLAQELRTGADKKDKPAAGSNPAPQSGAAATHNPIWATEFSKDGRYLAAGGQDRIVRVWAVISTPEERTSHEKDESDPSAAEGQATHLSAPVFQQKPYREYHGHTATVLDLSWSKNNFLLSSSMDKTVRLWHVSRSENLCTFKHTDFVPSIQFHPKDDRFFLAGSLDTKLRLWSIPDKSVAFWSQLPDMITSVAFTPDGKTCIAGTLGGRCMFYETEGLKYQTQIQVKSTRGQNAKGSKITGIQATIWPPGSESGDVKLLVSSNDSRVRLYNLRDKSLEAKLRGHENNCSQIRATFADDTGHVICGSEDRKAYIWSTCAPEGEKRNQRPVEMFDAHSSITTCAIIAPLKTRHLLSSSEDPIFDLCNPPPVTLVSRTESLEGVSRAPSNAGSVLTPAPTESNFRRVAESPAYIARSAHTDGNIIVTADYTGAIKVFRQDCAFTKRSRAIDNWDTASVFSKRTGSKLGRPSSILSHRTGRTRRDSTSTQPPDDRIMSWRQDISHGSYDSASLNSPRRSIARSVSPRKFSKRGSIPSHNNSPRLGPIHIPHPHAHKAGSSPAAVGTPKTSLSNDSASNPPQSSPTSPKRLNVPVPNPAVVSHSAPDLRHTTSLTPQPSPFDPLKPPGVKREDMMANPMSIYNGQSWAFWNNNTWREQLLQSGELAPPSRPDLLGRVSTASKLSSEAGFSVSSTEEEEVRCKQCGSADWKVRMVGIGGKKEERRLVCGRCGVAAP